MDFLHHLLDGDIFKRAPVPELTTVNGVVMSVVYVTARPTFTGVIGGYTTASVDSDTTKTQSNTQLRPTPSETSQSRLTSVSRSTSLPLNSVASTGVTSSAAATGVPPTATGNQGASINTAIFGASSTDSASNSAPSSSDGSSLGAKIGVAVGILCGIGLVAALTLVLLARKRKQMKKNSQAESEKKISGNTSFMDDSNGTTTAPPAPRLSLRPVSRLVPEFIGGGQQKNRLSQGNMLTPMSQANGNRMHDTSPAHELTEQVRPSPDRSRPGANPFQDPENPFADPEKGMRGPPNPNLSPIAPNTAPIVASAAMAGLAPTHDQRISGPTAESFPIPQSQAHMQNPPPVQNSRSPVAAVAPNMNNRYELAAAPSPIVAQGPGPETPQGNVYRILMDFRPTMEDELELRSGQLVRMLHEYDDGWALCIRLDRSQQGVVPRTCLAAKPSKPRPNPQSTGQASRPMTPQGRSRASPGPYGPPAPGFNPNAARAQSPVTMSPDTGAFNQPPRPLSPGPRPQPQQRSMSPGPYAAGGPQPMAPTQQRRRSNSVGAALTQGGHESPGPGRLRPEALAVRSSSPGLAI